MDMVYEYGNRGPPHEYQMAMGQWVNKAVWQMWQSNLALLVDRVHVFVDNHGSGSQLHIFVDRVHNFTTLNLSFLFIQLWFCH